MAYFNYHATALNLISNGHLIGWYYTENHNKISPALVLLFDDIRHPIMPIRKERWHIYNDFLKINLKLQKTDGSCTDPQKLDLKI